MRRKYERDDDTNRKKEAWVFGNKIISARCVHLVISFIVFLSFGIGLPAAEQPSGKGLDSIISPGTKPQLLYDGKAQKPNLTFTEGPSWLNGRLYFSNYYIFWKKWKSVAEGGPMELDSNGSCRILNPEMQTCGTIPWGKGNLAVCDLLEARIIEMSPEGKMLRVLADAFEGKRLDGPNDIVSDAKGGLYFTEPRSSVKRPKTLPGTAVFYRNPQGKLLRVTGWNDYEFPNGCILSPDGKRFYLNCSVSWFVWVYDVHEDGTLENRRKFAELAPPKGERRGSRSNADGMTVDMKENIYVATPAGIEVFNSSGALLGIIELPKGPSNCIFGGADMKTLFATCRDRIYSIRTTVAGLAYPPR